MEIFDFEDLNIYHDKDWNEMQRMAYREMKKKDIELNSKLELLNSPYEFMIYDSFVDMDGIADSTNMVYNDNKLVITDDIVDSSLTTIQFVIEVNTNEVYLDVVLNSGEVEDLGCYINQGKTDENNNPIWINIYPGQETILPEKTNKFSLRFELPALSDIEFNNYTLFLNKY